MNQSTSVERVIALLEEATQTPPHRLTAETVLEDFNGWDSMGMVTFLMLVESSYGIALRTQDLLRCPTPSALARLLQQRTAM